MERPADAYISVKLSATTRSILADLKQHPRETWDDVVRRLAESAKAAEKPQQRRSA